ncbi:MAG TPA: hypothetical protein VMX75_10395, partial [Spirochaetia bacterium]|nr:hypothetical protein [Spirochaetia bacterium]
FVHFPGPLVQLRLCLWGCVGILTGLITIAILFQHHRWKWLWISVLIIGVGLHGLGTGLRRVSPALQMVPLFETMPSGTQCLAYRFTEGTLVFYANKRWEMTDDLQRVKRFLEGSGPRLVVFLEAEKKLDRFLKWQWNQWMGQPAPIEYEDYTAEIKELAMSSYASETIHGLNLGRSTWVTIRVFYRFN